MGTLGDNLLKLTEFPFSYSLIGLLALIFGEGLSPGEDPLTRLGPLLILMGFVATVLSITDPIGALQKRGLSQLRLSGYYGGYESLFSRFKSMINSRFGSDQTEPVFNLPATLPKFNWVHREDGTIKTSEERQADISKYYEAMEYWENMPLKYLKNYEDEDRFVFGGRKTAEELEAELAIIKLKRLLFIGSQDIFGYASAFIIPWTVLICLIRNFLDLFGKHAFQRAVLEAGSSESIGITEKTTILHELLSYDDSKDLEHKINSMRDQTLRTTWIVREIDKITAMVYFAIIISIFISAEFLIGSFLDKFLVSFQEGNQTEVEGQNTTATGGGMNAAAGANGATSSTMVGADLVARIIIIVFSFAALGAVLYMLYRRLSELRDKAWTTFKFLVTLDAIKIENERFNPSLKDIERYLSNGDWTMAKYWVGRVMDEYVKLIIGLAMKEKDVEKKE